MGLLTGEIEQEIGVFIERFDIDPLQIPELAYNYLREGYIGNISVQDYLKSIADEDIDDFNEDAEIDFSKFESNRIYGAKFEGVDQIQEYEDDLIWIPSSGHCLIKLYERIYGIKIDFEAFKANTSTHKIKKYMRETHNIQEFPSVYKYMYEKWVRVLDKGRENNLPKIFEFKVRNKLYHVGLFKTDFKPTGYYINDHTIIDKTYGFDLKMQPKLRRPPIRPYSENMWAFDIETFKTEGNHLFPYGVSIIKIPEIDKDKLQYDNNILNELEKEIDYWKHIKKISLINKHNLIEIDDKIENLEIKVNDFLKIKQNTLQDKFNLEPLIFKGENCLNQLIDYIDENYEDQQFQFYAHNGSKFDTIFFKQIDGIKFIDQIKVAGGVISLKIETKRNKIEFKDSLKFFTGSLKSFCKAMQVRGKDEFDIKDWSLEMYKEDNSWEGYLKQDVICLTYALMYFENIVRDLGLSISDVLGTPGLAWKLLYFQTYELRSLVRICRCPVLNSFVRSSVNGGRTIVFKRISKNPMISIDNNSLYPAAMYEGEYPYGIMNLIPSGTNVKDLIKLGYMFIAEVEMDGGNRKYPLIPYKDENGMTLYPAGKFRGVYNSVDIEDALNLGYKVSTIFTGIYWYNKSRMFANVVDKFYKKKSEATDEALKQTYKILLNSMYGKLLQTITTQTIFIEEEKNALNYYKPSKAIKLKNGQYELDYKSFHPESNYPTYLASFVLSYARRIMNNVMVKIGLDKIYMTDTDSIYLEIKDFLASGIELNKTLGGFKNDYGEGIYIEEAIFLDLKRYYLKLNTGEDKIKFNGFNFLEGSISRDFLIEKYAGNKKDFFIDLLMGETVSVTAEKWLRGKDYVKIDPKKLKAHIDWSKRYKLNDDSFLPKDFNTNLPSFETVSFYKSEIKEVQKYVIYKDFIHSNFLKSVNQKDIVLKTTGVDTYYFWSPSLNKDIMKFNNQYYEYLGYCPVYPPLKIEDQEKVLVHANGNINDGVELSVQELNKLLKILISKKILN